MDIACKKSLMLAAALLAAQYLPLKQAGEPVIPPNWLPTAPWLNVLLIGNRSMSISKILCGLLGAGTNRIHTDTQRLDRGVNVGAWGGG